MKNRVHALRKSMEKGFDGFIVADPVNMLYFTELLGAPETLGGAMILIPSQGESTLYIHGVNYEWAKAEAKNCQVELVRKGENMIGKIGDDVDRLKLRKLGVDTMSLKMFQDFSKTLSASAQLESRSEYVWNLRRVKDEDELEKMRKAAILTVEGMETAYDTIEAGLREYEVAAEIEHAMRSRGSSGFAFESSVASGIRSAFPHGGCGDKKLATGDLVVVDIGAKYQNYCSDMTRTFTVGKPSAKQTKLFAVVREAQEQALQGIHAGVKAADVDAIARGVIEQAGYGEYFVHGLGHGIGLEVHEQPVLNSTSKDVLAAGNAATDEPGVYLVGFGGVRVEDSVVVHRTEAEKLTDGLYFLRKP
jgi:Xaa-Pro aminopeptidase